MRLYLQPQFLLYFLQRRLGLQISFISVKFYINQLNTYVYYQIFKKMYENYKKNTINKRVIKLTFLIHCSNYF